MGKGINPFNLKDSYGGGGSVFPPGVYKVLKSIHTMFDFNGTKKGKDGEGICCLMWKVQAVDPKTHKALEGVEPIVQYWGAGDETKIRNKGKEIEMREDATHEVIWKGSDYFKLFESLGKADPPFDMDKYEDEPDVTVFEGMVFEMTRIQDPYELDKAKKNKGRDIDEGDKDKKKLPREITIVTGCPKAKGGGSSKEEKEEKPAASKKDDKKKDSSSSNEPEDLVENYLRKVVFVEDNESGIETVVARSGLNRTITKSHDAETAKACILHWNKKGILDSLCTAYGWELDGDNIKKSE